MSILEGAILTQYNVYSKSIFIPQAGFQSALFILVRRHSWQRTPGRVKSGRQKLPPCNPDQASVCECVGGGGDVDVDGSGCDVVW